MIFHSFDIFICAHYVSLYITHLCLAFACNILNRHCKFLAVFFFFLRTIQETSFDLCMYAYIYVERFLFWFRSMSSTYGEIEIFPILLLRLPSSSFYLKRKRKKKKRKDTLNWSFFTFVYPRIHLIRSALQIVINTCFIYFGFVRNMKTKMQQQTRENSAFK